MNILPDILLRQVLMRISQLYNLYFPGRLRSSSSKIPIHKMRSAYSVIWTARFKRAIIIGIITAVLPKLPYLKEKSIKRLMKGSIFMDISLIISEELDVKKSQVEAAIKLIDEGNTIPFIARYRKEATGQLDDEKLRRLDERLRYLRSLEDRKETVLSSIEEQGKLTDDLKQKILNASTLVEVEDLYLPYRPKRKTRASTAKERGLEPLAKIILQSTNTKPLAEEALAFVDSKKDVNDVEAAISGAQDIIAEQISDNADYRNYIRELSRDEGILEAKLKNEAARAVDEKAVYEMYYDYTEAVKKAAPHRILAVNRGEAEKILSVKLVAPEDKIKNYLYAKTVPGAGLRSEGSEKKNTYAGSKKAAPAKVFNGIFANSNISLDTFINNEKDFSASKNKGSDTASFNADFSGVRADSDIVEVLKSACDDAYTRLIAPAIERDIRNELSEKAEDSAIKLFGKNLYQLLMQPPIAGKTVLGWDPAFRTGCKIAIVDKTGKVLDTTVIYPTAPQNRVKESKEELKKLIKKYAVDIISLGNGTASRESEQVIVELIKELDVPLKYVIVNEAGASVYSASKLAAEEFPHFDVGQRSAASMARRLQDPLAELVKIDPKSIGVGQYQHDMDQKKLSESLAGVVEDCVNKVGIDLNTASAALLQYISGINKAIAANIVAYREENGSFTSRTQLKKVAKLGPKAFEQCAGFLRIHDGKEPLDNTSVHPESYSAAKKLMEKLGISLSEKQSFASGSLLKLIGDKDALAAELGLGKITLLDIISELEKPSRDPRESMPSPILKSDVLDIKDLREGMILKGTVRNIMDFGAFVDIGVHHDGLVHISRMSDKFIKHPLEVVSIGDIVDVEIISIDIAKQRIGLNMRIGKA